MQWMKKSLHRQMVLILVPNGKFRICKYKEKSAVQHIHDSNTERMKSLKTNSIEATYICTVMHIKQTRKSHIRSIATD